MNECIQFYLLRALMKSHNTVRRLMEWATGRFHCQHLPVFVVQNHFQTKIQTGITISTLVEPNFFFFFFAIQSTEKHTDRQAHNNEMEMLTTEIKREEKKNERLTTIKTIAK